MVARTSQYHTSQAFGEGAPDFGSVERWGASLTSHTLSALLEPRYSLHGHAITTLKSMGMHCATETDFPSPFAFGAVVPPEDDPCVRS
ncbi:hypothetical protein Landi51_07612 [Colletotrichum acutatum]